MLCQHLVVLEFPGSVLIIEELIDDLCSKFDPLSWTKFFLHRLPVEILVDNIADGDCTIIPAVFEMKLIS
ncbi:hypothetical protein LOK49_LG14G00978 [Camellia lanceoleosa]|uniref:Uncharacterized protein n=1 Tax=Camellia lanceoleosa TaxID=1840588 RepID=A0ACC0FET3_9ERIC|nr:hypothetical protein LOK49_LG14G00978 [Camellia lanceoleosa]